MDAEGGEKLRCVERLYCILDQDAVERGISQAKFYHLSDQLLAKFKMFQGFQPDTAFPGSPVRQAYLIWAQASLGVRTAIAKANGVPMTDQPILPGEAFLIINDGNGKQTGVILKNPRWY